MSNEVFNSGGETFWVPEDGYTLVVTMKEDDRELTVFDKIYDELVVDEVVDVA